MAFEEEKSSIRHYRVDKIKSIEVINADRSEESGHREFDMAAYTNKVFGMYGGEQKKVTLVFPEQLIGVMLDRFGKEVSLKREKDCRYSIRTDVVISEQFFGWLTGLGKQVQILSPDSARQEYKEFLQTIIDNL